MTVGEKTSVERESFLYLSTATLQAGLLNSTFAKYIFSTFTNKCEMNIYISSVLHRQQDFCLALMAKWLVQWPLNARRMSSRGRGFKPRLWRRRSSNKVSFFVLLYIWFQYRSAQIELKPDQFHNLFKFFKHRLFYSFSEFQSTQMHLKFYPNTFCKPMDLNKSI